MSAAVEPLELVVLPEKDSPLPMFTGKDMVAALTAYRDLQTSLDRAMPDQIIALDGKPFRKKGYWRAISVAFNLEVDCVLETRDVFGTLDGGAENYVYRVTYRARAKSGRAAIGDGTCTASEKQRGRMRATEHNVRSHAHTRAYNRAVSNLCGFGEVSAEEVEDPDPPTRAKPKAAAPKPAPGGSLTFTKWMIELHQHADQGTAALQAFWQASDKALKTFLMESDAAGWMAIKQRAAKVSAAALEANGGD